uniref:G_PROTEIN_RECEP_F1_2 domain-containing protein n=1 Tax=Macrostomum lignano TaxID=282301 RepID=A0A1I8FI36_9PLAT
HRRHAAAGQVYQSFNNQTQNWTDLDAQLTKRSLQISPAQALICQPAGAAGLPDDIRKLAGHPGRCATIHLRTYHQLFHRGSLATSRPAHGPRCRALLGRLPTQPATGGSSARSGATSGTRSTCLSTTASILNLCIIAMERFPGNLLVAGDCGGDSPRGGLRMPLHQRPGLPDLPSSVVSFYAPLLVMAGVRLLQDLPHSYAARVRGWHTGAKVVLKKRLPWRQRWRWATAPMAAGRSSAIVLRIHRGRRELTRPRRLLQRQRRPRSSTAAWDCRQEAGQILSRAAGRQNARRRDGRLHRLLAAVLRLQTWLSRGGRAFGQVATWLGYANSCINPAIYAHSMRDFRRAFIRLLGCQRRSRRLPLRRPAFRSRSRCCGHPDGRQRIASTTTDHCTRSVAADAVGTSARHGQMLKADSFVRRAQRAASLTAAGPLPPAPAPRT